MLEISQLASKKVEGVKLGSSFKSQNGKYIYHISIIDYLQKYDFNKKVERFYKINVNGAKRKEISSMDSEPYGNRFLDFMKNRVFSYSFNQVDHLEIDIASL